jgi:sarcosine oxidase subunit gamma
MVETYQRRSALAHFGLNALASQSKGGTGITVGEISHRAIVNIRGNAGDLVFSGAVKAATGLDLPVANTVSMGDDIRILWLGPDEWWVVSSNAQRAELIERLRQSFSGQHTAVVDVSESRSVITIAGPAAREVLARGISLDLHPRAFGPGQCAQTGMAKANIVLHQIDNQPSYEIYILKSFGDYLWRWIGLVAEDFGLAIKAE